MSRCKTDNQPSDVRNRRTAGAAAHLDKEEAGCRGRVMVDVDCDQHACNHDKHHQQDAQDQTSVKRMSAFHSVYSTVSWHHWKTQQEAIMLAHTHSVCYFRVLSTAGLIITLCHMLKASVIFSLVSLQFCCRPAGDTHYSSIRSFPACANMFKFSFRSVSPLWEKGISF